MVKTSNQICNQLQRRENFAIVAGVVETYGIMHIQIFLELTTKQYNNRQVYQQ